MRGGEMLRCLGASKALLLAVVAVAGLMFMLKRMFRAAFGILIVAVVAPVFLAILLVTGAIFFSLAKFTPPLFALIGGGVFIILYFIRKTDPKNKNTSEAQDIKSAQEFLPFGRTWMTKNYRNMSSDGLTACFPFYNAELSHPSGIFVGVNVQTRTPIYIDFALH